MRQTLQFSGSPQKDFKSLISSIEDKLSQLAADESAAPCALPNSRSSSRSLLALEDLAPAHSPVLQKLDRMEADYMSQISALHQKISMMEAENCHLSQLNNNLESTVFRLESEVNRLEKTLEGNMRAKIEEIEVSLTRRWRVEVEEEIGNYVREIDSMRQEIGQLRRGNRELLKQKEVLLMERDNLDFLYRQILDKYKMALQADIDCFQREQAGHERATLSFKMPKQHQAEGNASKKSKKRQSKAYELSRDELVPFLTKGIEELREKLKMKP